MSTSNNPYMKNKILTRDPDSQMLFDLSFLIIIFYLAPLAVWTHTIPHSPDTNLIVLSVCTSLCVLFMAKEGWLNKKGFDWNYEKKNTDLETIVVYATFTLAGIAFLLIAKGLFNLKTDTSILDKLSFRLFVIPLCFAQVLSYRTFLIKFLNKYLKSERSVIIANTMCFTTMHCMFSWQFILICFIGGLGFAFIYYHYRNFLWMGISHTILNVTAALIGAFST